MKIRLVYTVFLGILLTVVLMGNKNGRASQSQKGNTGAPGDETNFNGTPRTCINCHTASPISATLAISVLDSAGNAVTQYVPSKQYTARVTITATSGNPQGYGFQMIALKDANNSDLDGFSDPNPNNYKIATVTATGRTYAEHDNVSTPNIFNVKWMAPPAGTGNVTFYSAGNAVNKNGLNSGDGASFSSLKLTESSVSSTQNPDAERIGLQVWPNPATSIASISATLPQSGTYNLTLRDASGQVLWEAAQSLPSGENLWTIPMTDRAPGMYFASLFGNNISANVKILKL